MSGAKVCVSGRRLVQSSRKLAPSSADPISLHRAAQLGRLARLQELLDAGVSPDARDVVSAVRGRIV